jgi:hypothetical protein
MLSLSYAHIQVFHIHEDPAGEDSSDLSIENDMNVELVAMDRVLLNNKIIN